MKIPTLYRGDSDNSNKRKLRILSSSEIYTNLINEGNPSEINGDLLSLINKHVNIGNKKTHFLSFSENIETAIYYGLNGESKEYYPCDECGKGNTFALITFDYKSDYKCDVLTSGIYNLKVRNNQFDDKQDNYLEDIILIDVVSFIQNKDIPLKVKENSLRDKEWLLYPNRDIKLRNVIEKTAGVKKQLFSIDWCSF